MVVASARVAFQQRWIPNRVQDVLALMLLADAMHADDLHHQTPYDHRRPRHASDWGSGCPTRVITPYPANHCHTGATTQLVQIAQRAAPGPVPGAPAEQGSDGECTSAGEMPTGNLPPPVRAPTSHRPLPGVGRSRDPPNCSNATR